MPKKPLVPCRNHHAGCPHLVDPAQKSLHKGYCPICGPMAAANYDKHHREKTPRQLYTTNRWKKFSRTYRARHPVCTICGSRASDVVDHIQPHNGNPKLFWDKKNLQALCKRCHDRKTATQDGGFGNVSAREQKGHAARQQG